MLRPASGSCWSRLNHRQGCQCTYCNWMPFTWIKDCQSTSWSLFNIKPKYLICKFFFDAPCKLILMSNRQEHLSASCSPNTKMQNITLARSTCAISALITVSNSESLLSSPHQSLLLRIIFYWVSHLQNSTPHLLHASRKTAPTSPLPWPHPETRKHVQQMLFYFSSPLILWATVHSFDHDEGVWSGPCLRDMSPGRAVGLGVSMYARSRGCRWKSSLQRWIGEWHI